MEVGTEISQKIRSAIKAKLMELGAYVDDELPDYIMVMVANKKNKAQMRSDLSLFLGNNTDAFTTWLHGLLGKLQTISVESGKEKADKPKKEKKKDKSGKSGSSKKTDKDKKKNRKRKSSQGGSEAPDSKIQAIASSKDSNDNTAPVAAEKTQESKKKSNDDSQSHVVDEANHTKTDDNLNDSGSSKVKPPEPAVQEEVEDVRQLLVTDAPGDELAQELDAAEEEVVPAVKPKPAKPKTDHQSEDKDLKGKEKSSPSSDVSTHSKVKRKMPSSVVSNISRDQDEDEYDPLNPAVGSVASVVRVTSRKANVPQSMQANRALLVRAMTDAEKSVTRKRKIAVTKPINRRSSPSEYSPKRWHSSGNEDRQPSPPPYVPSKKSPIRQGCSPNNYSRNKSLSRDDIRHTLGNREDGRRLVSSALHQATASHRSAVASSSRALTSQASSKSVSRVSSDSRGREVRGDHGRVGDIKNLQITARVGPMRGFSPEEDSPSPPSDSNTRKDPIRVTIVSSAESKQPERTHSKQEAKLTRKQEPTKKTASSAVTARRDARDDILATRREKVALKLPAATRGARGAKVISKLAKDAVQKQCKAAVMSLKKAPPVARVRKRAASVDSGDRRVIRRDSKSSSEVASGKSEEDDDDASVKQELGSDSDDASLDGVVAAVSLKEEGGEGSPRPPPVVPHRVRSRSLDSAERLRRKDALTEELELEDVDDLSKMLEEEEEDEDLDSKLLSEPPEETELALDLDDDDLSHVVDEVTVQEESEKKGDIDQSGIRFIVTLDGVEGAQYHENVSSKVATLPTTPVRPVGHASIPQHMVTNAPLAQPMVPVMGQPLHPPLRPLPQSTPLPLQQAASVTPTALARPRPPKIQPFSISLRDSDDDNEEKIVTYVQAGDISAANIASTFARTREPAAGEELSALQRARMQERCRYWPACAAGTDCQYHHPTTHCKTFPNCKFGDKCLFIHPNCRFDSKCTRPDCPFTHTSKRPLSQLMSAPPPPRHAYHPKYPTSTPQYHHQATTATICHYFPNCLNPHCTFLHPKPCMYGQACKIPTCAFYHPVAPGTAPTTPHPLPDKDKLKWRAPQTTLSPTKQGLEAPKLTSAAPNTKV